MGVDLHSDFLSYLSFAEHHGPHDKESRSSVCQLKEGRIHTLVTVVYASTSLHRPSEESLSQVKKYFDLLSDSSLPFQSPMMDKKYAAITLIPAIENCSSFAEESESLEEVFRRFTNCFSRIPPLYASLTWNEENRFGGGALSQVGLKEEGKRLLDFLDHKVYAIDLSHASDALARESIEYIEKNGLSFKLMASHSNFREVMPHVRNLPFDVAKYIVQNNGVIGLTLLNKFIGERLEDLFSHISYALKHGFEKNLAFGGDFFSPTCLKYVSDVAAIDHFPEADTVACFPYLYELIEKEFSVALCRSMAEETAERLLLKGYKDFIVKAPISLNF